MAIIDQYRSLLTVLVEFEIDPNECDQHVANIKEFLNETVKKQEGFISANLHTSLDKSKVVNYAQWKNEECYQNFLNNPEVQKSGEKVTQKSFKVTLLKVAHAS
ncbi:MAG: antibiotic biosynthesis monooxygenase [Halobacteriovoraceae bacterium]|nr:antibiotic biosynthesis monooxygenase [Halobacteriovoraceae bacterium]